MFLGLGMMMVAITLPLVPGQRAELLAELPGESAKAAHDYDRYLMREVFNDGGSRKPLRQAASRPSSPLPTILARDQTARGPRLSGLRGKEQKSKLQILRGGSDELSSKQAQRDLDSYWRHQTQKYGEADVRSRRPVMHLPHPASVDRTPDPHANHHSHYRYVRPHSRNDRRVQGVAPWDYRWRRPGSASGEPYEKFETARKVKTELLSSHQGPVIRGKAVLAHSQAEMPPMPGSFATLVTELKDQ